jgi:hypothetical protein
LLLAGDASDLAQESLADRRSVVWAMKGGDAPASETVSGGDLDT